MKGGINSGVDWYYTSVCRDSLSVGGHFHGFTILCVLSHTLDVPPYELMFSCVHRKLLFGSMTVKSYSNADPQAETGRGQATPSAPPTSEFLAKCISQVRLTSSSECCCLYPDEGNIHEIQAER